MKSIHIPCPNNPDAYLNGTLLSCETTLGLDQKRPAVIVCPGGGYLYCCGREGEPVAMSYLASGFHAFVLYYSIKDKAAGFAPLKELDWAIGVLREHADEWNIQADKIAVCGFSAGGHMALAAGLMAENKPNAMILGYPATSAPNDPYLNFMLKLLSGKEHPTDADAAEFDLVPKITKDAPPVFMVASSQDMLTKDGALAIANAYSNLDMEYELHVFAYGPHGFSLGSEAAADGSSRMLDPAIAHWQELSVRWLLKTFGQLTFEDKPVGSMGKLLAEMGYEWKGFVKNP